MPQRISWLPCICGPGREAAERGRGMGHVTLGCGTCSEQGSPGHRVLGSHRTRSATTVRSAAGCRGRTPWRFRDDGPVRYLTFAVPDEAPMPDAEAGQAVSAWAVCFSHDTSSKTEFITQTSVPTLTGNASSPIAFNLLACDGTILDFDANSQLGYALVP